MQGEHMVCYDALQEAGLLPRLNQARTVAQEALYDPFTKQRLAEGLAKHLDLDDVRALMPKPSAGWCALERQLAAIPVKQRLIDGRMSDFARLSAARYRYQTEMRGRRPEQVKAYLDEAARIHAGKSFADLAGEPGMTALPAVEVFFGSDSLSRARRQRAAVDLTLEAPPENADAEAAKDEIRRRNLNILTPQRAARFIERHLPAKGDRISTEQLHVSDRGRLAGSARGAGL